MSADHQRSRGQNSPCSFAHRPHSSCIEEHCMCRLPRWHSLSCSLLWCCLKGFPHDCHVQFLGIHTHPTAAVSCSSLEKSKPPINSHCATKEQHLFTVQLLYRLDLTYSCVTTIGWSCTCRVPLVLCESHWQSAWFPPGLLSLHGA